MLHRQKSCVGLALSTFLLAWAAVGAAPADPAMSDTTEARKRGSAADTGAVMLERARSDTAAQKGPEAPENSRGDEGERTGMSVLRAYICRGIDEGEPTEAGKSFVPAPDGILRVWCFSEIGAPATRDTIQHVWHWGEREMARVPLEVKGPRFRTWSTKQILDEWSGEWHVDIIDREGLLLSRLGFSVEQPRE